MERDRGIYLSTAVMPDDTEAVARNRRCVSTPVSRDDARSVVRAYSVWSTDVTPSEISTAFRIEDEARLGFWNALIIASALKAGATRVLPEDLNAGQVIAGVKIHNPFR